VAARTISGVLSGARRAGRQVLLEPEGYALLDAAGIRTPRHLFVRSSAEAAHVDTSSFTGPRLVIKVVSPEILHKSDVGGIAIVPNRPGDVRDAVRRMETRLGENAIEGFLLCEFVPYDGGLGGEFLIGLRWTEEFGTVLTIGPGGIYAEFLAGNFKAGRDVAILSPVLPPPDVEHALGAAAVVDLATGGLRGQPPRLPMTQLTAVVSRFLAIGREFMPHQIAECEVNPLVVSDWGPVALDVLVKLGSGRPAPPPARPVWKMKRLLEPRSAAIIGVSEQLNPGHIILNNLLREGFDRDRIYVVKPRAQAIEGCRCVPDVASLPERVDLFVLAVSAAQVPQIITDVVAQEKAESLIVIPGGLEEKQGTSALVDGMRAALARSRTTAWEGPLINGGNCLGIQSKPGRYDTMFIPEYKLPAAPGRVSPVAIVSQSGAFAIARASKLSGIHPKFTITTGNQMDVTVGDYLTYLKDDPDIEVFALYLEVFRPLDGLRVLDAAAAIVASGRTVILYRAGRTPAGAKATASHTASIAGDYVVTRALARTAGIVVADSLDDFEDLVRLFAFLRGRRVGGRRLGAISNAGFECVAIADNLGALSLAAFDDRTVARLNEIFTEARIDSMVDVHNPIDLTPMTGDAAYEAVVRAVMEDPQVDVGVVGCVPLTAALQTLPPGASHAEDVASDGAVAMRLRRLRDAIAKPWVAVIDSGALYDPMARLLEETEIPTFRTADRALRLLNVFCDARLRGAAASQAVETGVHS
jgi:acyl-CoA synthetase (NDP forming)